MKLNNQYSKFLEKKHKNFNTSEEIVNAAVLEATGGQIQTKFRIIRGENNEVYDIHTTNNKNVIVRIARHEDWHPFKIEQWIFAKCRALNIPVPEMLLIKELTDTHTPISICVQTKLSGITLDQIDVTSQKDVARNYLAKASVYLAKIHSIQTQGFDGLDKYGHGVIKTYKDWLSKRHSTSQQLLSIADKIDLNKKYISEGLDLLDNFTDFFPGVTKSYLIYNDFGPKHIFVKNGEIQGFIDFEVALAGDPVYDFAKWEYYFSPSYPLQWVMNSYPNKALFDKYFKKKLYIYMLHHALGSLKYDFEQNHTWGYEHAAKQIVKNVDELKKL